MTKKIRFGISQDLNKGFSETIQAVADNAGQVRFEVISLDRIETDPENPRELTIGPDDIAKGLDKADPKYQIKHEEFEKLQTLSDTIKTRGLINPVVVYKHGEKYRLVAGERRYLASLLGGKRNIQSRILNEKPKNVDLRLLQWIENNEREDLSLKDRIGNLEQIIQEYKKGNPETTLTATVLKNLISVSLPQATYYLSILNSPVDVRENIKTGAINNLDKAAIIAKVSSSEIRKLAIDACIAGCSLKQLRGVIDTNVKTQLVESPSKNTLKKRGRALQRINMGTTQKPNVIKKIVQFAIDHPACGHYKGHFTNVNWNEYNQATKAFRKLVELLEIESE